VLKPDNQPAYRLAPQQCRRFCIVELEGFVVEFRSEGTIVDEVIFHQPNGTFIARRLESRLERFCESRSVAGVRANYPSGTNSTQSSRATTRRNTLRLSRYAALTELFCCG
jgi:hypothetical protein